MKTDDITPHTPKDTSARQRVSNAFSPLSAGYFVSGRTRWRSLEKSRQKVTVWPSDVPKSDRISTALGRKSFAVVRHVPWNAMRRGQRITVEGHLLVCCEAGQVLIERGPESVILQAGQGAVISDGEAEVSELPLTAFEQGLFYYAHFTDRVLAELTPTAHRTAAFIMTGADYPHYTPGMIPFGQDVLCAGLIVPPEKSEISALQAASLLAPMPADFTATPEAPDRPYQQRHILRQALIIARNRMMFPFLRLLSERVIIPRIRVALFLESFTMAPDKTHPELLDRYPGGAKALRKTMRDLGMPSPESVVRSRRFEIAHAWNVYGENPLPLIAAALRVRNPKRFITEFERWVAETKPFAFRDLNMANYSDRVLAATYPPLAHLFGEYWFRRERQEQRDAGIVDPAEEFWQEHLDFLKEHNPEAYAEAIATPPLAVPDSRSVTALEPGHEDAGFLKMESSGMVMALRAHRLARHEGLEDCESLLRAA